MWVWRAVRQGVLTSQIPILSMPGEKLETSETEIGGVNLMDEVMSRQELLELYTQMIRQAKADYDSFEDSESRRKFMNSIAQVCNLFNSVMKSDRLDAIEAEIKALKEAAGL